MRSKGPKPKPERRRQSASPTPQIPPPSLPHFDRRLAGFLGLVLLLKVIVVFQLRHHPLTQPDVGLDTTAYAELAKQVLAGDVGLGPGLYYVSPLYIYFLAAGLAVSHSYTAVRLLQVVLGTASVALIFLMARRWFGERAGWIAAGFAALTGLFTFYESLILQASLDPFMTSAALLCLTYALTTRPGGTALASRANLWLLAAGVTFGLETLNRPNVALAVGGVTLAFLALRRLRPAAVLVAGLVIGMSPGAIRNVIVSHQLTFASSQGGLNFYIGNHEAATGFFKQIPGIAPSIAGQARDAQRVAERALGHAVTENDASSYFFGLALTWIREHPGAAIALFAKKVFYTFNAQHIALPYSYPFYAYDANTVLRFYVVSPMILVPLGLVGLAVALKNTSGADRANLLVWASFVPSYAAAVAVFFVSERYRLPLLVPLAVGAGAAVDFAVRAYQGNRLRAVTAPAVAAAILLAVVNYHPGLQDGRWEEGLRMAQRLVIIGRYDEAEQWTNRLEPNEPKRGLTQASVGMQYLTDNLDERALPHLVRAQQLKPGEPDIEYSLGQALVGVGRPAEAVPHLRAGLAAGIEKPLAGYDLAVALQTLGDFPGAVAAIRQIHLTDDDAPEVWLRLGRLAAEVKAPDVAEPFFRHGVELAPDQGSAHQQYGLDLLVLGRHADAARELAAAVRLDPRDADSLSHLAYCEYELHQFADARAHADAALAINPADELAKQLAAELRRIR